MHFESALHFKKTSSSKKLRSYEYGIAKRSEFPSFIFLALHKIGPIQIFGGELGYIDTWEMYRGDIKNRIKEKDTGFITLPNTYESESQDWKAFFSFNYE